MHRSDYFSCMAMAVKQQGLLGDKEGKIRNTSATVGRYGIQALFTDCCELCENCSVCTSSLGDNSGCSIINETVSFCNLRSERAIQSNTTPNMNSRAGVFFRAV